MADSMSITGGTPKIDYAKWKKLTPQEIIKEQSKGQEIPAEIVTWAQQMQRFDQIPDDVTYEEVDGEVGIEALNKLGLANTQQIENVEEGSKGQAQQKEYFNSIKEVEAYTKRLEENDKAVNQITQNTNDTSTNSKSIIEDAKAAIDNIPTTFIKEIPQSLKGIIKSLETLGQASDKLDANINKAELFIKLNKNDKSEKTEEPNSEQNTQQNEEQPPQDQTLTLADPALTTDPEEIRKRKAKKGLA